MSQEADAAQRAGRARIVSRYAGPIITTVVLAGSAGYETYRWSSGQTTGAEFAMQLGKTGSVVTLGFTTGYLVSKSEFLMTNPYRAGGVVTAVVLLGEEAWLIYRCGGFANAFSSPTFFVRTGGNFGAAALGLIGFVEGGKAGATIGTSFGPWGSPIGAVIGGFGGGLVGGLVGYFGGAALTDWMLETLSPEFYYKLKLNEVENAESEINRNIDRLIDVSAPLSSTAPQH